MSNTQFSWNYYLKSCIANYLYFEVGIKRNGTVNYSDSYESDIYASYISDSYIYDFISAENTFYDFISAENAGGIESGRFSTNYHNDNANDFKKAKYKNFKNFKINKKYRHLWIQCENCFELNYRKFLRVKKNICEQCGYHFQIPSSDRIRFLIDRGTWNPMDEDMISGNPIHFQETYRKRMNFYRKKTGLTEAVQTGIGRLNGIPVAIGVMDFKFFGGSMGSVVGEKITRLIEYATNRSLPLVIVCTSGGARMQEGCLGLMQMAKISSASHNYQLDKKLFYVSILTSPTTGGVMASFGMLGDIIIAEPNAYIAFAGKRVIEQALSKGVSRDSQRSEHLFHKGLFDKIVPRSLLKGVLGELFKLHGFFPLKKNSKRR